MFVDLPKCSQMKITVLLKDGINSRRMVMVEIPCPLPSNHRETNIVSIIRINNRMQGFHVSMITDADDEYFEKNGDWSELSIGFINTQVLFLLENSRY